MPLRPLRPQVLDHTPYFQLGQDVAACRDDEAAAARLLRGTAVYAAASAAIKVAAGDDDVPPINIQVRIFLENRHLPYD